MTESTTAPTSTADPKKRSVGFPSMPLQEAVDAVVLAGHHGPDHSHDAFATYLGHQTSNSGAYRAKLASLRDWGLISRGSKDRVTLSALAQDLVLAAPDHYAARHFLLTAFESCRVFGMLYNDSAKSVPMDIARLRSTALMRYGVGSDQVDRFVDSFIKSAVFAELAESDGTKITLKPRDTVFGSTAELDTSIDRDLLEPSSPETTTPSSVGRFTAPTPGGAAVPTALRQAWPIDAGEIEFVIRTPKAMPAKIYGLMAEMAETAERMASLLTAERSAESVAPSAGVDEDDNQD